MGGLNTMTRIITVVGLGALMLLAAGCNQLKSRDQMNKGVQAYRNQQYAVAVDHFKQAVQLDPKNVNGKLYLATAYMVQYVPGSFADRNMKLAKAATDGFLEVLKDNPSDRTALASLASLSYQEATGITDNDQKLKKLDEAKDWYMKLIQADPGNKDGYYSLAVIDWLKWYPNLMTARSEQHMKPEDPGPIKDKKVREELKAKYGAIVDDGLKNLDTALQKDPKYDDAMAYKNLFIRERADLDDSEDAYKKDIADADKLVQQALQIKKEKSQKNAAQAVQADK